MSEKWEEPAVAIMNTGSSKRSHSPPAMLNPPAEAPALPQEKAKSSTPEAAPAPPAVPVPAAASSLSATAEARNATVASAPIVTTAKDDEDAI